MITGDNLGGHCIGGFVENFSGAYSFADIVCLKQLSMGISLTRIVLGHQITVKMT